jgi:TonB family protein
MMDNFLLYVPEVAAGSALFCISYMIFFRKDTFYIRNRIILILSILLPVIVPLLTFSITVDAPQQALTVPDMSGFAEGTSPAVTSVNSSTETSVTLFSLIRPLAWLYFAGIVIMVIRSFISLLSTYNIIRGGVIISEKFPTVLISEKNHPPFSFFPYTVIPVSEYTRGNYSDILDHESAHLRQGHTFDLLLSELFIAFQWFNPFAWLLKRFMVLNHEYLADHVSLSNRSIKDYQYRLLSIAGAPKAVALTHTFNCELKSRIIMINKKPTNRKAAWKILIIIPAVIGLSYAFVEPEYKYITHEPEPLIIYESKAIIQKNVKGIVTKEDGKPLEGVYIASTGSLGNVMSAYSSSDGRFILSNVQDNAFLVLNCSGYASVTVKADFKSDMTILMSKDNSNFMSKSVNTSVEGISQKPLSVLDGEISNQPTSELISKLGNEFGTVVFLKGKEATDKYGEAGKNGVEEVYSRKKATELGLKFIYRRISPDEYPTFQGKNFTTFNDWVIRKLKYPAEATSKGIHGRITVYFSVEADGSVSNVKLQGKSDPLIADAVIKAVQSSPKWEPALKEEARVPFTHMVSLKFELPDKISPDDVYVMVEKMPMYPGGDKELLKFIAENTIYPSDAKGEKIEGRVIVRFIVNTKGDSEEATVLKGVHPLLDDEGLRVVNSLKGFEPGMHGGKPVNVWYMVPINFVLPKVTVDSVRQKI